MVNCFKYEVEIRLWWKIWLSIDLQIPRMNVKEGNSLTQKDCFLVHLLPHMQYVNLCSTWTWLRHYSPHLCAHSIKSVYIVPLCVHHSEVPLQLKQPQCTCNDKTFQASHTLRFLIHSPVSITTCFISFLGQSPSLQPPPEHTRQRSHTRGALRSRLGGRAVWFPIPVFYHESGSREGRGLGHTPEGWFSQKGASPISIQEEEI